MRWLNGFRLTALPQSARTSSHKWSVQRRGRSDARPSYWHELGAQPLLGLAIGRLVERAAQRWPDGEALVAAHQGRRLTFAQVLQQADRVAAGFLELGLQPGDRIGIWGPNSTEWYITSLAASRAGLILVTVNPAYQASELQYCIEKVRIKALVTAESFKSQNYYNLVQSIVPDLKSSQPGMLKCENMPSLTSLIVMSENNFPGAFRFNDIAETASTSSLQKVSELQNVIECDDPANIQFTSGTTGKPKAAVLSHHNIVNNSYLVGKRFGFNTSSRICLQVPLFHCYGFCNGLLASLHYGSTLVLPGAQFNAEMSLETLHKEACTVVYGTPTMYVDVVNLAKRSGNPLPTQLTTALSSGSPCSPHLFQQIRETFNLKRVCSVYGLTETSPVIFQSLSTDTDEQMTSTIGHVSEHVEAKIVDSEGRMVPLGSPGELWVRGYISMLGYWEDKAKTEEMIGADRWLKTGDQFVLREDGYGQVVGRLKDVIIRGGENIYPKEIEDFLETHPKILEAQVFGVPDSRLGEVVCAFVRLEGDVGAEDIKQYFKGKIAHFKIPSIIKIVEEFPKTASGKIQKFRLKEMVVNENQK